MKSKWLANVSDFTGYEFYPGTPLQSNIVAQSAIDPTSYVLQLKWKVNAPLCLSDVELAASELMKAHSILRTRFVPTSAGIFQILTPSMPMEITVKSNLEELSAVELDRGFTSDDPQWFRIGLVQQAGSPNCSFIVLTLHHVTYDGWSLDFIVRDLKSALEGGRISASPPFKRVVQFIEGQNKQEAEHFWRGYLKGWAGPPTFSRFSDTQPVKPIVLNVSERLQTLSKVASKHSLTVSTLTKAAWALALRAFLQVEDIVFGNVVSGRDMDFAGAER